MEPLDQNLLPWLKVIKSKLTNQKALTEIWLMTVSAV